MGTRSSGLTGWGGKEARAALFKKARDAPAGRLRLWGRELGSLMCASLIIAFIHKTSLASASYGEKEIADTQMLTLPFEAGALTH